MFKTYVINLNDSTSRLSAISQKLAQNGIEFTRVEAVDGRKATSTDFLEYSHRKSIDRHGRGLTGGEVACYLSHIRALKAFVETEAPQALILEDDASFVPNFGDQIRELSQALEIYPNWDVVNLVEQRRDWKRTAFEIPENTISRAFYFPMLTSANLWSREGAIAFLNSKFGRYVSGPIDTELRSFCAVRGKGLSLEHSISSPSGVASDIDNNQVTRSEANANLKRRPIKPRIVRHFPDYANAWISMNLKRIWR